MGQDDLTRREADQTLQDLATGIQDLQGMHRALHREHGATRESVVRLNYAVFGIPDTDEKGLLGEMREIGKKLDTFLSVTIISTIAIVLSGIAIAVSIVLNG